MIAGGGMPFARPVTPENFPNTKIEPSSPSNLVALKVPVLEGVDAFRVLLINPDGSATTLDVKVSIR